VHPNRGKLAAPKEDSDAINWDQYGLRLCAATEGYEGILCGTCRPGFGQTSPFTCKQCFGTEVSRETLLKGPDLAGISGLYVMYWVVLTAWYLFSVWSAMSTKSRRQLPMALPTAETLGMRAERVDVPSAKVPALGSDGRSQGCSRQYDHEEVLLGTRLNVLRSVGPDQCGRLEASSAAASKAVTQVMSTPFNDSGRTGSAAASVPAAAVHVHSRSLDIIKVGTVSKLW
jgi:hypothetical protein